MSMNIHIHVHVQYMYVNMNIIMEQKLSVKKLMHLGQSA